MENTNSALNKVQEDPIKDLNINENEAEEKEIDLSIAKKVPKEQPATAQKQMPIAIVELDEDDDEDEDEKNNSQKLVIDLSDELKPEEELEEEESVKQNLEMARVHEEALNEITKTIALPKPEDLAEVITLSDGEGEMELQPDDLSKPGKVQKRRSLGSASATGINEEERFRLKRRKINVVGAPKMPLTGYVRYMNDRRDSLKKDNPHKTAVERTKMIGEEWQSMSTDLKQPYMQAAEEDKQRYLKELHDFLKERPDILASELAKNKNRKAPDTASNNSATASSSKSINKDKNQNQVNETKKEAVHKEATKEKISKEINSNVPTAVQTLTNDKPVKRKRTPTPPCATTSSTSSSSSNVAAALPQLQAGEIPIFTNEFLEHNKIYDQELKSLRKSKTDLEQQNAVLEKHVENMKFGVEKMVTENNELQEKNRLLEVYLDKLKNKLAHSLSSLPLPTAPNGATVENIDKYMQDLYKMSNSNSHGPATLNKAKDIIRKLDLQIQL